jgi:hypothetical protein
MLAMLIKFNEMFFAVAEVPFHAAAQPGRLDTEIDTMQHDFLAACQMKGIELSLSIMPLFKEWEDTVTMEGCINLWFRLFGPKPATVEVAAEE